MPKKNIVRFLSKTPVKSVGSRLLQHVQKPGQDLPRGTPSRSTSSQLKEAPGQGSPAHQKCDTTKGSHGPQQPMTGEDHEVQTSGKDKYSKGKSPSRHHLKGVRSFGKEDGHQKEGQGVVHLVSDPRLKDLEIFRGQTIFQPVGPEGPQGHPQETEEGPQHAEEIHGHHPFT